MQDVFYHRTDYGVFEFLVRYDDALASDAADYRLLLLQNIRYVCSQALTRQGLLDKAGTLSLTTKKMLLARGVSRIPLGKKAACEVLVSRRSTPELIVIESVLIEPILTLSVQIKQLKTDLLIGR